jgi:hypothetical protein
MKFTFKVDTVNENSSINEKADSPFSKKKKASVLDKRKRKRMSEQKSRIILCPESPSNISPLKNSKTLKKKFLDVEKVINKKSYFSENKPSQRERISKGSLIASKSGQNINSDVEKSGIKNSMAYFAKEKKEDCKIQ